MKPTKQLNQKLINACKNNNAKAQMQLYKGYCKAMFLVAKRYVKDQFLAEDIMQEAFIKAFKNIQNYKVEVAFGAWLKKIVINQSIDELKKRKILVSSINEEVLHVVDDGNWEVKQEVTAKKVVEAIQQQKEKFRLVLTLYLMEGYDHKEISKILNITEVASRTNLMRGKKLVKEYLKTTNYVERY